MIPLAELEVLLKNPEQILREQIPGMLAQLAAVQAALAARLLDCEGDCAGKQDNGDRLLDVREAAAKLSVTEDWLYRKGDKLPFIIRLGRNIRFSEQGIEKYIRQRTGR